ncbi:conserved domain protein [Hyphomonas neptunium ATCC 15444]|uniref:Conserved domain protein n=2 Tax=Hyphomonas TaxID=85 RepID=Q0C3E3_HYPNA|nr:MULTISPECIES: DUF1499 domain-containing protein [Hyphomonas]ABI76250.1 conserved domain protein [Hyphomonas neptunium ATCC 15444]KCZ96041.1 hypothetical protein HHI_00140 [Hyphomonas hirschiana VP5]
MTDFLDFQTLKRPPKPNTALIAPEGFTPLETPDGAPPVLPFPPAETFARLLAMIEAEPGWKLVAADGATGRLRFIAVTKLLRFKDDVDVTILPVDGAPSQSTFAAYSRSRVGYSDLGTNRKRLDGLSAALSLP